jgi:hypothetical protein
MKNKNLKKLANQLLSKTNEREELTKILGGRSEEAVGNVLISDIVEADACEDIFKCRNGFSCQTF